MAPPCRSSSCMRATSGSTGWQGNGRGCFQEGGLNARITCCMQRLDLQEHNSRMSANQEPAVGGQVSYMQRCRTCGV